MPELVIGQSVRPALSEHSYALRVIWVGFDSVVCEYIDDAGDRHEQPFRKDELIAL